MVAGNVIGEKFPMFVIGKSKTPRCFNHIKELPWKYKSEKKSWMESQTFEEWVRKLNQTMPMEGRKIVLLFDNCPAHLSVSNVKYVQLLFLSLVRNGATWDTSQKLKVNFFGHFHIPFFYIF